MSTPKKVHRFKTFLLGLKMELTMKGFRFMKLYSSQEKYHLREVFLKYPKAKQIRNEITGVEYEVLQTNGYYIKLRDKFTGKIENFYKIGLPDDKVYTVLSADIIQPPFGQNPTSAVDTYLARKTKYYEQVELAERKKRNQAIINTLKKPKK